MRRIMARKAAAHALFCSVVLGGCSDSSKNDAERAADARAPDDAPAGPADAASEDDGRPSDGGADGSTSDASADTDAGEALRLSDTGLYSDAASETLGDGVVAFRAKFELWSDGATKRRFLYLPPGTTVDTSDMDDWRFPVGTKAWKEFTRDGTRVETRLVEKRADGWFAVAFLWNAEQNEAVAEPLGASDALGTPHDVPNQNDCHACHRGAADFLLGVSAIQLSHDTSTMSADERAALGLTLGDLVAGGRLSVAPSVDVFRPPGDDLTQQALGTLHANCGHCHRPGAAAWERTDIELRLTMSTLDAVERTPAYVSAVGVQTSRTIDGAPLRITPGNPQASAVYVRMASRDPILAMPALATERVDSDGSQAVSRWISSLAP
jgi:hypothetical protein